MKILVADDNKINIYVLKMFLEKHGHEVYTAINGIEAVELALSEGPHLIFMDLDMPEMDGIDATLEIRGFKEYSPSIYAYTAMDEFEWKDRCMQAGMNGFLSKPFSFDQVEDLLRQCEKKSASNTRVNGASEV